MKAAKCRSIFHGISSLAGIKNMPKTATAKPWCIVADVPRTDLLKVEQLQVGTAVGSKRLVVVVLAATVFLLLLLLLLLPPSNTTICCSSYLRICILNNDHNECHDDYVYD